jgi:hypothetical protein
MKKKIGLAVGAIVAILLGFGGKWMYDTFTVKLHQESVSTLGRATWIVLE